MAQTAVASLTRRAPDLVIPEGPLHTVVSFREGTEAAGRIARRWGLDHDHDKVWFESPDIHHLYHALIRICYLTPWIERRLAWLLPLFNLKGRFGMAWLRHSQRGFAALPRGPH
ncbi:MAG: hypothetical protein QNI88_06380 [Desulfobacterales bacterium]|nr:hypothetical protein [Desulfobacterales bacterium]